MGDIFRYCKLPENFTLDDKFDTSEFTNMSTAYKWCELPEEKTEDDFSSNEEKSRKSQTSEEESLETISSFQ